MAHRPDDAADSRRTAWVWLDDREPRDPEVLTTFAVTRGVRDIFVSVPWGGPDRRVRETAAALRRAGMRVSALGGSAEWAERPRLAREWAGRAGGGDLFDGIHLDIEPWTLPSWSTSAPMLLAGLADAVRLVRETTGTVEVDMAPHVAVTHPTGFMEVVRLADAISLMSYRDTAHGVLAVSIHARRLLASLGRPHRLAVDTLPSADPGTSFAGRSASVMAAVMAEVAESMAKHQDFMGVAVHDLVGWRALPQ